MYNASTNVHDELRTVAGIQQVSRRAPSGPLKVLSNWLIPRRLR